MNANEVITIVSSTMVSNQTVASLAIFAMKSGSRVNIFYSTLWGIGTIYWFRFSPDPIIGTIGGSILTGQTDRPFNTTGYNLFTFGFYLTGDTSKDMTGVSEASLFGELAVHGNGPYETYAVPSCSPAIRGAVYQPGITPSTDQNGVARDTIAPTIGASETPGSLPCLSVPSIASVAENAGTVSIPVTMSGRSGQSVTVLYSTAGGSAVAGVDFTTTSGKFTFNYPTTSQTISIPIKHNLNYDPPKTFSLVLSSPVNATLTSTTTVINITNVDAKPSVKFTASTISGNENTTLSIQMVLTTGSFEYITVPFTVTPNTATQGTDFVVVTPSPLMFPPYTTSNNITVNLLADNLDEYNELFTISIATPTNATTTSPTSIQVTIDDINNPPTASLPISSLSVSEDIGTLTLNVTLSGPSGKYINVSFSANGTATSPSNYELLTESPLQFPPGVTSLPVKISIYNDSLFEDNEFLTLMLTGGVNSNLGLFNFTIITILDNPPAASFPSSNITIDEDQTLVLNVTLSEPTASTFNVSFNVTDDTATSPSDYELLTESPLQFPPGVTSLPIAISIKDVTGNKEFEVYLIENSSLGNESVTVTIVDTTLPPPLVTSPSSSSGKQSQ
jgi:hypothetical protein